MSQKILLAVFFLLLNGVFHPLYAAGPSMVEKDLFSIDRKPPSLHPEDTNSKAGGQEMAIGNIELEGIIIRNNSRKALLRIKNIPVGRADGAATPRSPFIAIREGETVKGYRVTKIELRSVSLQKDGRTYTIGLFAGNREATSPSAAASSMAVPQVQVRRAGENVRPRELPRGIPRLPPGVFPGPGFNPGKPPGVIPRRMP